MQQDVSSHRTRIKSKNIFDKHTTGPHLLQFFTQSQAIKSRARKKKPIYDLACKHTYEIRIKPRKNGPHSLKWQPKYYTFAQTKTIRGKDKYEALLESRQWKALATNKAKKQTPNSNSVLLIDSAVSVYWYVTSPRAQLLTFMWRHYSSTLPMLCVFRIIKRGQ